MQKQIYKSLPFPTFFSKAFQTPCKVKFLISKHMLWLTGESEGFLGLPPSGLGVAVWPASWHTPDQVLIQLPTQHRQTQTPYSFSSTHCMNDQSLLCWKPHSKHRFLAPSSKLCQIWLRHWRGTLYLHAAVQRRGQYPPEGSGTNMTVEAT